MNTPHFVPSKQYAMPEVRLLLYWRSDVWYLYHCCDDLLNNVRTTNSNNLVNTCSKQPRTNMNIISHRPPYGVWYHNYCYQVRVPGTYLCASPTWYVVTTAVLLNYCCTSLLGVLEGRLAPDVNSDIPLDFVPSVTDVREQKIIPVRPTLVRAAWYNSSKQEVHH